MNDRSQLSRRDFLKGAGAVSLSLLATQKGKAASAGKKPNIVYVLADQLRYQSCGFAGDTKAKTPNLDKFAKEGVSFCNAISGHPVCAAYRASLMTGLYTTSTGMVINELRMNPNHDCLAHVLTRNGYETGYIGKWHLYANQLGNHEDPKNSYTPSGPYRLGFDGFWASYGFHHEYYKGYYHTNSPEKIFIKGYEPDGQTDLAIEQLNTYAKADKPFALFLSVGTPHAPWNPENVPPEYLAMFTEEEFGLPKNYKPENDPYSDNWGKFRDHAERDQIPAMLRGYYAMYYAMTANLDWNFGRLMDAIDRAGVRDNTIVVFTSDHGEMMGSQGRLAKNIFYEEAVRVPFLVRWPGKASGGRTTDACLNTPDIMPTLLTMAGLPIPKKVEGTDLSGCAFGKKGKEPEAALLENTGACASWDEGFEWRALRSKKYTYGIYRKDGKELLFDNQADPYQMTNLADDPKHAADKKHFRAVLKMRMAALDDDNQSSAWYRDHWTKDRIITHLR